MGKSEKILDVLIIGAGVAGLTAGIYAARFKLDTLILEDELIGGQIKDAYVVENYPGFERIKGSELTEHMQEQALMAGAKIDEFDKIVAVSLTDEEKMIETKTAIYRPHAVIIAAGMKRRELPVPQEKRFRGKGIHYCELCDGHLYEGKSVAVVGGGNGAVGGANFLDKYAKKIYVIYQFDKLEAEASQQEILLKNPKVTLLPYSRIIGVEGETAISSATVENVNTMERTVIPVGGIFVYIGSVPNSQLFKKDILVNEDGSIIADETCETNVRGVYAAGDIRTKQIRQLTTAVSDGTIAAFRAEKYIDMLKG